MKIRDLSSVKESGGISNILIVFFILLVSSETLYFGTNAAMPAFVVPIITSIFLVIELIILSRKQIKTPINIYLIVLLLIVGNLLTVLFNLDFSGKDVYNIVMIITAAIFVQIIPINNFYKAYENVVFVICIFSIITYIIYFISPNLLGIFPRIINSSGYVYLNMGLSAIYIENPTRLYGPFREPGVTQIFVCIALLFQLTNNSKENIVKIIVYIFTIILTFSTTGYINLIILTLLYIYKLKGKKIERLFILLGIGAILFYIVIKYINPFAFDLAFNKLTEESGSADSRRASVITNIEIALDNPLFGVGNNNIMTEWSDRTRVLYSKEVHNTNTLLKLFAMYGVPYGLIFTIGYIKLSQYHQSIISSILFLLVFIISYIGEAINQNILIYIWMFYGYVSNNYKYK